MGSAGGRRQTLQPFAVDTARGHRSHRAGAGRAVDRPRPFERPRLAYRDVASATNRLTLIAAILPAGMITTHTLFCLQGSALDEDAQHFLAGIFNSFVANYLVRLRVSTHVTVAIVERLPMPRPRRGSAAFGRSRPGPASGRRASG